MNHDVKDRCRFAGPILEQLFSTKRERFSGEGANGYTGYLGIAIANLTHAINQLGSNSGVIGAGFII